MHGSRNVLICVNQRNYETFVYLASFPHFPELSYEKDLFP